MDRVYERINWINESDGNDTPLGASNLNKMDYALSVHDERIVQMDARLESQEWTVSSVVGQASASATSASASATKASASATSASASATKAQSEAEKAKTYADNAEAIVGVGIATKDKAGLVKGGDNYIAEDGTLMLTKTTTDRELIESVDGGIKIISIDGESQQNGTPTPNKEVPINSVEVSELLSTSGNFYNANKKVSGNFPSTARISEDGWIEDTIDNSAGSGIKYVNYWTSTSKLLKPSTDYKIFVENQSNVEVNAVDNGTTSKGQFATNFGVSAKSTLNKICTTRDSLVGCQSMLRTFVAVSAGTKATIKFRISVLADTSITINDFVYRPYTETKATLSAPIVLRGIGDAKDTIVKKDGVYGSAREYIPFVIDGTQDITRETADVNGYRFRLTYALSDIYTPASMSTVADMMSDKFPASKWTDIYYGRTSAIGTNAKQIGWFDEKFKNFTVAEMKAWLTENPISGFYRLAAPTFEPLPLADQIALHKLETFGGVTYLFTDSTIEPIIEVEYGTSKVGAYAIKGLNTADANALMIEQLKTLTNELATQIVAGSEG